MSNRKNYPIGPSRILTYEEVQKINPRLWEKDWLANHVLSDAAKKRQAITAKKIEAYFKKLDAKNKDNSSK